MAQVSEPRSLPPTPGGPPPRAASPGTPPAGIPMIDGPARDDGTGGPGGGDPGDGSSGGNGDGRGNRLPGPPSGAVLILVFALVMPLLWIAGRPAAVEERTQSAAQDFATGWAYDHLQDVTYHPASGPDLGEDVAERVAGETQRISSAVTPAERDHPVSVVVAGDPRPEGEDVSRQRLRVTWDLGQGQRWEYDTFVTLRLHEGVWLPVWNPSVIHPALVPGLVLNTQRLRATREQVIGAGEQALMTNQTVVDIGIRPGNTDNRRRETAEDVARILGLNADELTDRVMDSDDEALVPVRTLLQRDCTRCADLRAMRGVEVATRTTQAPARPGVAPQLLGDVRPADEELRRIDASRIAVGDVVGTSGLQRAYDAWLAGRAGVEVRAVPAGGSKVVAPVQPLWTSPPVPGRPLRVTFDPTVQRAAEDAVAAAPSATTVLAVDVTTGEITAVATKGAGPGNDHGLGARVPPGWAFTLASTLALMRTGMGADAAVECPPILDVGGQRYTAPAGTEASTLQQAFVRGCRTALAGLSDRVSPEQLSEAASLLGYGRSDLLGTQAFRGSVPTTQDAVLHTSALLGEGQVLASPLAVARASATVASGRYIPSRLVLSPPPPGPDGGTEGAPAGANDQLFALQDLMRRSVTERGGTANALAAVPGEVAAVAGSASYGPDGGTTRQVWATGYRAEVAFAVLVENTTAGPPAATSVAAAFLRGLPVG